MRVGVGDIFRWLGGFKWRYFWGIDEGRVVSGEGPLWGSEDSAREHAEETIRESPTYDKMVVFEWDSYAKVWQEAWTMPGLDLVSRRELGVGFWWGTSKWRYFFAMESGRVVSQEGPVWLSDSDAQSREADIAERGLMQGRALSPLRYDWDVDAGVWKRT